MFGSVVVCKSSSQHAESPVWDTSASLLLFVDILSGSVLAIDHFGGLTKFSEHGSATSICLSNSGSFVIGQHRRIRVLRGRSPKAINPKIPSGTRLNEAKVDCRGRLWVASMDLAETNPTGAVYRIGPNGGCSTILKGLTVGNGIDWSPDSRVMYLTDSGIGCIYSFDFDPNVGSISNRRIFARIPRERGVPDGLTVDCRGGVWSAHFDGGQLTRYHSNGEIDFIIDLPAKSPTSLCFGGKNLSDLYITTSTFGKSTGREHDGSVLRIPTEFTGLAPNRFDDQSHLQSEANG